MPTKDESVVKEREREPPKKRKIPDLVYNDDTKRWVKKDGAVGKRILEKKKEKETQDKKEKKERVERKKEREVAKEALEELESENKRLKGLVVPSLLAASYVAPCVHPFADSRPHFGKVHTRVCNICGKEWELMVKSKPAAKAERFVAAVSNARMAAVVNSPYLEKIAETELDEATVDMKPARRVGKSGLSSGLTNDFDSMSVQKDAPKKGQGRAGCWGK
jgi:hypothetical protein